ncbi:methylcobalamin:coenzyme M methyltransferase [bacterium BMS3Bbin06]|nr:methylcobalamin:coenzyme M methyltransferase [bacterium BMS3Abin08]GBE34785.1 methylcobalamin:coenzyme M methyltransferase [bacterium BMS3Bbin06]HDY72159.1 uroporphyrinogen decarboxylase [Nitrospirota bacterium]
MGEMSCRERVLTALEHREPDRVPSSIWCTIDAYKAIRRKLGLEVKDTYPVGSTTWTQDVPAEEDVVEKFGADLIRINVKTPGGKSLQETDEGLLVDEWGVTRKRVEYEGGSYLDIVKYPLEDATEEDLDDYPWPDPTDPAVVEGLRERAQWLRKNTPYAILLQCGRGGIFEQAKYLRGYAKIFEDFVAEPEFIQALFRKLLAVEKEFNRVGLEAAGEFVDIIRLSPEDLASEKQTFCSPSMFREMILPHYRECIHYVKGLFHEKNPDGKIEFHSCGAVSYPFMDDLLDSGIDIYDSLEVKVREESRPVRFKERYGDRLSFLGGIDVQWTLPFGKPEDVRNEVRERISEMAPGGGYILSSSHRLTPDFPFENISAMYEATREFGKYPIK